MQEGSVALNPNTGTEHLLAIVDLPTEPTFTGTEPTKRLNQSWIFSLIICTGINIST